MYYNKYILYMHNCIMGFRTSDLGNLPGINGDEGWYGVQVNSMLAGRPFAMRTPTGLPLNPFFAGVQVPLLFSSSRPSAFSVPQP